jgi:hemoglobin
VSDRSQDAPAVTAYAAVGAEAGVRALVDRFYDLMDLDSAYTGLRALHPARLDGSRDKLYWYLCGWLGGPQHYVERFGHPRLRARHLPFSIGVRERDQWLGCMRQALTEVTIDAQLAQRLNEAFFNTADWMRNRAEG